MAALRGRAGADLFGAGEGSTANASAHRLASCIAAQEHQDRGTEYHPFLFGVPVVATHGDELVEQLGGYVRIKFPARSASIRIPGRAADARIDLDQ